MIRVIDGKEFDIAKAAEELKVPKETWNKQNRKLFKEWSKSQ